MSCDQDSIIYEYGGFLCVIQRSPQDQRTHSGPSENVKLAAKLPVDCHAEELGRATLEALDNYDKVAPQYSPWELKELRKQMCEWTGASSNAALVKNCRMVLVFYDLEAGMIRVIAFDNHNINPWETMLKDQQISLKIPADPHDLGCAIKKAFEIATYHPERKIKSK